MIRIQLALLRALYALLAGGWRNGQHRDPSHFAESIIDGPGDPPRSLRTAAVALYNYPSFAEILTAAEVAIGSNLDASSGVRLIDTLVDLLSDVRLTNRITPEFLGELQTAVLTPDELAKFRGRYDAAGMRCPGCRHQFVSGEAVGVLDQTFLCLRCINPEYRVCAEEGCDEMVRFSSSKPNRCRTHRREAQASAAGIAARGAMTGELNTIFDPMRIERTVMAEGIAPPTPFTPSEPHVTIHPDRMNPSRSNAARSRALESLDNFLSNALQEVPGNAPND